MNESTWPAIRSYVREHGIDWRKVLSGRLLMMAAVPGIIVGALLGAIWEPLAYLGIPVFTVMWLTLLVDHTTVLYCPHCAKRVKADANTCHHCGRDVVGAPGGG